MGPGYGKVRAEVMAANLARTVEQQRDRGNEHTLLFAHDGHVDKASAAFRDADLGKLAAQKWGDRYRVIGTDLHHARIVTGDREDRWTVTMNNPSPLRGIFAHTDVGYLDFAGDSDTAIAIRTALLRDGTAYVQAGAGVVADSDPAAEDTECRNKAAAVLRAVHTANRLTR